MDILSKLINQKVIDSYISIGSWLWITLGDETVVEISSPWTFKKGEQEVLNSESENIDEVHTYLIGTKITKSTSEMKHGVLSFSLVFDNSYMLEASVGPDDDICIHNISEKQVLVITPNGIVVEKVKEK